MLQAIRGNSSMQTVNRLVEQWIHQWHQRECSRLVLDRMKHQLLHASSTWNLQTLLHHHFMENANQVCWVARNLFSELYFNSQRIVTCQRLLSWAHLDGKCIVYHGFVTIELPLLSESCGTQRFVHWLPAVILCPINNTKLRDVVRSKLSFCGNGPFLIALT